MDYSKEALKVHKQLKGKLTVVSKLPVTNNDELSVAYTPGVAEPCKLIDKDKSLVYEYTMKSNYVGVVTDGTAVLGLGNIGPEAGLPVMEGKCVLFKEFGGVDAVPICLNSKEVDEFVNIVTKIAPAFGGFNLEDIGAPNCFIIERRLKEVLDIPVFHDDQHGTAVVVLAGLINAHKVLKKELKNSTIVINGCGAAGTAIGKILINYGVKKILMVDKNGIINKDVPETMLNWGHEEIAQITNLYGKRGTLADAMKGADVFIGVSRPGLVTKEMITSMNKDSIVFAMANPVPEITPVEAKEAGAKVIGTGRSDYPNQVNNVLAFPGMFRGALDVRAKDINEEMKLAAADALASIVEPENLSVENLLPKAFDKRIGPKVAAAVAEAAVKTGIARLNLTYEEELELATKIMN